MTVGINSLFFYTSIEDIKAVVEDKYILTYLEIARTNYRPGQGAGPRIREVIKHYADECRYRTYRRETGATHWIGEALDRLLIEKTIISNNTSNKEYMLPSIHNLNEIKYPYGFFDFTFLLGKLNITLPGFDEI